MAHSNLLQPLVDAIETVKGRITEHGQSLRENETRTRIALIDPILQALGWDVSEPRSVTLEYDVSGRRADYALLQEKSRPAATIEAKRLGENLQQHLMQMLNYANASGVDYAGLTDGDTWELYDVFKRGELRDRQLLEVSLSSTPTHEAALKLLILWRPNIESRQPQEANPPIVTVPTKGGGERMPPIDIPPSLNGDWISLAQIGLENPGAKPNALRLPDDAIVEIRAWADVMGKILEWLYSSGRFSPSMVPFKMSGGAILVDSTQRTRTFRQAGNYPFFVERHGNFHMLARRWQFVASQLNVDLNSVHIRTVK